MNSRPTARVAATFAFFAGLLQAACGSGTLISRDDQNDVTTGTGGADTGSHDDAMGGARTMASGGAPGKESPMGSAGSAQGGSATGGTPVVLERSYLPCDVELIVASRCRRCHSVTYIAQEPLLETWSQISAEADLILEVIADDFMPMMQAPLTDAQKALLLEWVEEGTPSVRATSPPDCTDQSMKGDAPEGAP